MLRVEVMNDLVALVIGVVLGAGLGFIVGFGFGIKKGEDIGRRLAGEGSET